MKTEYERIEMEVILFDKEDVIVTSGEGEEGGNSREYEGPKIKL